MPSFINTPVYILNNVNVSELGKFKKAFFLFLGIIYANIEKIFNKNLYCFFINILPFSNTKSRHKQNFYFLEDKYGKFYFTNKRFTRMVSGIEEFSKHLASEYLIDKIDFRDEDIFIDCGANVGELIPYFYKNYPNLHYYAFEPDTEVFEALKKNFSFQNGNLFSTGLSNQNQDMRLYVDTKGADTSLEKTNSETFYTIKVKTLDSYNFKNVKLIKIDGEGHEKHILEGAKETLSNTKYVSVDHSAEKGINKTKTTPEVYTFLIDLGFTPIFNYDLRDITLFENSNF